MTDPRMLELLHQLNQAAWAAMRKAHHAKQHEVDVDILHSIVRQTDKLVDDYGVEQSDG